MTQLFIQNQFDQMPASVLIWLHLLCCCQSLSRTLLFVTLWTAARQAFLSFAISRNLPRFMSIDLVMPSNHLVLQCPLLLGKPLQYSCHENPMNCIKRLKKTYRAIQLSYYPGLQMGRPQPSHQLGQHSQKVAGPRFNPRWPG